jgi:hypothetical protein
MTATYRPELPPRPPRVAQLPLDDRGYPVPWFVARIDGKPEFRAAQAEKFVTAVRQKRCWVCGDRTFPGDEAFLIGPMCVVNRTTAEPPSHVECAEYSARACPFLVKPHMTRREGGMPKETGCPAGVAIMRNPGASVVWVTSDYKIVRDPLGGKGHLFQLGDPTAWSWWREGRTATRAEVLESIDSGLPLLADMIPADDHEQQAAFREARARALAYLPTA